VGGVGLPAFVGLGGLEPGPGGVRAFWGYGTTDRRRFRIRQIVGSDGTAVGGVFDDEAAS
jgi:hypothetical protein